VLAAVPQHDENDPGWGEELGVDHEPTEELAPDE
jgi:hypothetical protein